MQKEKLFETCRCRQIMRDNATILHGGMGRPVCPAEIDQTISELHAIAEKLYHQYGMRMLLFDLLDDWEEPAWTPKSTPASVEVHYSPDQTGRVTLQVALSGIGTLERAEVLG